MLHLKPVTRFSDEINRWQELSDYLSGADIEVPPDWYSYEPKPKKTDDKKLEEAKT